MYPVSSGFHAAVKNGNKQIVMLIFNDTVFTNEDINITRGISFHDRFNTDENLNIGQVTSNEISFSLFNDRQDLNEYSFGDFQATIGVYLDEDLYSPTGNVMVRTLYNNTYVGLSKPPYLLKNGVSISYRPTFPVTTLIAYDGKVYAFSADGDCAVYNDATGENITVTTPVSIFMKNKVKTWVSKGYNYNKDSRYLLIYDNNTGHRERYEFCPLGVFTAERPNNSDKILIDMTCYDLMQRFDIDMPKESALGISYPVTIGNLFKAICDYVGLPYKTLTFINSTATISKKPEEFDNSTMRTVLGWIAEAAASNARIDRDGCVSLDWVRTVNQTFDEGDYSRFEPYWYTTKKVQKLYNRDSVETTESTIGEGNEAYLIQDNPLLSGAK